MLLDQSDLPESLNAIPSAWLATPYIYDRYPGKAEFDDPGKGANCQLFAYAVLGHFGLYVPPLRSSDLWDDSEFTHEVQLPEPLDLVFVNRTPEPYGAHIGVYADEARVLHLCKQIGRPALWALGDFAEHEQYRTLIGFKRCMQAAGSQ